MVNTKENLVAQRKEFRALISQLPAVLDLEPKYWYGSVARRVLRAEKNLGNFSPEMREYLIPIFDATRVILREEAEHGRVLRSKSISDEMRGERAHINMISLSQEMAGRLEIETDEVPERFISTEELVASHPDVLSLSRSVEGGIEYSKITVRHPVGDKSSSFKLPIDDYSYHKGGISRLMLGVHANAPVAILKNEIPWNDVDIYTVSDNEQAARENAKLVGADEQGIEVAKGSSFNFTQYANGRDMTQNQVCLGRDGLHYSDAAFEAAKTGHIELVGHYIPDRAIYGVDRFPIRIDGSDLILAKPRGLMRYIKALSEGKARSFNYLPLNQNLDLGVYWLVLARKWANKPDTFPDRMQKMYYLAKQMDQVRDGEDSVIDVLNRVHSNYPFFDLEQAFDGEVGTARWLGGKLIKQLDREFGWAYRIPSGVEFVRKPNDTEMITVGTDGYSYDPLEGARISNGWKSFVADCNGRFEDYNSLGIASHERYFADVDLQGIPDYIRELL